MFPLSPKSQVSKELLKASIQASQSGLALVVTLVLLLVLMVMGTGIAYIASIQSDLVAAVANKPLSIEAGETCFDNALEWLGTSLGKSWVNGVGTSYDLAATGNRFWLTQYLWVSLMLAVLNLRIGQGALATLLALLKNWQVLPHLGSDLRLEPVMDMVFLPLRIPFELPQLVITTYH